MSVIRHLSLILESLAVPQLLFQQSTRTMFLSVHHVTLMTKCLTAEDSCFCVQGRNLLRCREHLSNVLFKKHLSSVILFLMLCRSHGSKPRHVLSSSVLCLPLLTLLVVRKYSLAHAKSLEPCSWPGWGSMSFNHVST